ncbi:glycosyltransferase [Staphylococcus chromogenes]|nr:glycosyltransferase [Staphylococcus chromogenes]
MTEFRSGISVIIPSRAGSTTIRKALKSMAEQSLDPQRFEVIVVINGVDLAKDAGQELSAEFPQLDLRVLCSSVPSAGRARNIGLMNAQRAFTTFLDDDDQLEPKFLESALRLAQPNTIVLMPIVDVRSGERDAGNSLNARIRALAGSAVPLSAAPWALGFNACKVVATELLGQHRYSEELKSGEDLVFFAQLFRKPHLMFLVPAQAADQAYLRYLTTDSVSRKQESFEFNVHQRLACIRALRAIEVPETNRNARVSLENAQFGFVADYLKSRPNEVDQAIQDAVDLQLTGLDWEKLRPESARRVVFSYCFPPFADTSANVTAKVIRAEKQLVDVYFADMSRVRGRDESTRLIVEPFVSHQVEIATQPSFADWGLICDYARKAVRSARIQQRTQSKYQSMYSRALWSGSHVAALLFKSIHPAVSWDAEFSDPMAVGVDGSPRAGKLTWNTTTLRIRRLLDKSGWGAIPYRTHFEFTEFATLACADQIIFTNVNQQKVMLSRYPVEFRAFVEAKSKIQQHVAPTPEMYQLQQADYPLDNVKLHIGYFGSFYANRGVGDVVAAIRDLPAAEAAKVALHVFTAKPEDLREEYRDLVEAGQLRLNGYVPYLEFLNLATKFDALLVSDVSLNDTKLEINPFLPSKYADYSGAGVPIWGMVTEDSPLSMSHLDFTSELGDKGSARAVLNELLRFHR